MHPELSQPTAAVPGLPERGEIFDRKYRIDGVLGLDGMGALLAATRLERGERVAIKVLLPDGVDDPALVQRFMREGRGSSKIRSEYVARATDVGLVDGRPYMVFEYAAGNEPGAIVDTGGIRTSYGEAHFPAPRAQTVALAPAARRPPSARAAVESFGSTAPIVPMRSALPGYLFAATVLLAMVAVVGWVLFRQERAVHEAEAHVEPSTVAAHFHLPPIPVVASSAAPAASSVVTTTSAVISKSASVEAAPPPVVAVAPPAPSPAPAPVLTPPPAVAHHRHAHKYVPPRDQRASTPAPADPDDNPYATTPAPGPAPVAPSDANGLFEIRK
jgi:hypothetical protein